jgi:cell division protein FtsL
MNKSVIILFIAIFTVLSLSIVRVFVSNSMSTQGIALDNIEKELSHYKTQNAVLREELLHLTSLDNIASKASHLGFVGSKTSISLNKPLPLAIKQ